MPLRTRRRPLRLSTWDPLSAWTGTVAANRENVDKYLCPCVCTSMCMCVDVRVHVYVHLCNCFLTRRLAGQTKDSGVRKKPCGDPRISREGGRWAQTEWGLGSPGAAHAGGVYASPKQHATRGWPCQTGTPRTEPGATLEPLSTQLLKFQHTTMKQNQKPSSSLAVATRQVRSGPRGECGCATWCVMGDTASLGQLCGQHWPETAMRDGTWEACVARARTNRESWPEGVRRARASGKVAGRQPEHLGGGGGGAE